MKKFSYDEAFRMVSLFKGRFRHVRKETNALKNDDSTSYYERYKKLQEIEENCVNEMLNISEIDRNFILGLHNLLKSYKEAEPGRDEAYYDFLSENVEGNIKDLKEFMDSNLLAEYDHAITHPKYIIRMYLEN
ncbi:MULTISPECIES: hypothetical protein [Staphylococcus]|uniref:Uncharacterized protein n=2 Tax=Staphylococcus pettenkoferi TaxID=170573 RepID=A0A2N6QFW8_9STAP|nr:MULTISPECIES: hypothetical protein [Staphylococcus]MBX8993837.1 hypothetical protein [Staphylococcus pettenkoferi]OFK77478.1 hypothetical protein HMPREF2802_03655 [Staphylococcus sp. HMSC071G07]PMC18468.1 hypothetical protein CJ235_08545 [Staphylococcus pettenkoferi]